MRNKVLSVAFHTNLETQTTSCESTAQYMYMQLSFGLNCHTSEVRNRLKQQ